MQNPLGRYRDAIFFASGFAGLIYESIWTHYLRLFLGHAAYAQILVLAIFMGGMAIGAGLIARHTARIASPLRTYALVEAAIGVLALVFHPLFTAATGTFYDAAFGAHLDGGTFTAIKWGLGILLILPQSILLGATFPLFASADTRSMPAKEGRSIATLYFANSLGGAVGVLMSGFVLVPTLGLFGTIASAGAINLVIAGVVLALSKRVLATGAPALAPDVAAARRATPGKERGKEAASKRARKGAAPAKPVEATSPPASLPPPPPAIASRMLLLVALLTGASSFIYEIGWIRMLSLVLGSATHSFELMLSSFVLGLALGGLWVRKRIDTAANPGVFLAYVQIAMGGAALATLPLHSISFDIVASALGSLPKTNNGYTLFNVVRYGIAALVMFPATFCAGMTLPLVTRLLYSNAGQGERAIGAVYSANTIGSIAGLVFAVNLGLPILGLEYLVSFGAVIDVILGAVLLGMFAPGTRQYAHAAIPISVAAAFGVAQTFDPQKLASGVFRSGQPYTNSRVLAVAHGKTATISVEKDGDVVLIKTNGKTDAGANLLPANFSSDQVTMALIGVVPLLIHDAPKRVANIGFGSGLTSSIVLADPRVQQLDTIEIEPKMVQLARHFDPLNRAVYTDSRSAIRIEDAKSFFAANGKTYDLILSEPSNPWVSGVSSLFSVEFYRHLARYLNPDGLFAQWLQVYETHPDRVVSVLKAMSEAFDDYLVVALDESDILLVGKPRGKIAMPPLAFAKLAPKMQGQLRDLKIANQADITMRIVGNKALMQPWLDKHRIVANSDFVPYLDSNADRDRFFSKLWSELTQVALSPVPIAEIMNARPALPTPSGITIAAHFGAELPWAAGRMVRESLLGPVQEPNALPMPTGLPPAFATQGSSIIDGCARPSSGDPSFGAGRIAMRVLPYVSPEEGRDILAALRNHDCLTGLSGQQAKWRALLDSVAARDGSAFGILADDLLVAGEGTNAVKARYLLSLAMLGRLQSGNKERARALWTEFSPRAISDQPHDLVLQILYSHAVSNSNPQ